MHAAGEQLLQDILHVMSQRVTDINIRSLYEPLSIVMARYEVTPVQDFRDGLHDLHHKIEVFVSGKRLEGLAHTTLADYKRHLYKFAEHARKRTEDVTAADIRSWLSTYQHQKTATITAKLSTLKSFFGWLAAEDHLQRDPAARVKPPKKEKRMPKALTIEELELLRESASTIRQRALMEVMYATGCRLSEVVRMNRQDIDISRQSARVIGKGDKEREVYFSFRSLYHLRRYLGTRSDAIPALFVTERKPYHRLGNRSIQRDIDRVAAAAGLDKRVTPHILRHTFATLSLNNGADLVSIQHMLGHASPTTTQIYAHLTDERKREQHKRYLVQ